MTAFSNYLEQALLNLTLRGTAFSPPAPYVSLHTADSTETGGSELSGAGYTRVLGTFAAPVVDGVGFRVSNSLVINIPMPSVGGPWTITHWGIWDLIAGGNLLYAGALTASQVMTAGQTAQLPVGTLSIRLE